MADNKTKPTKLNVVAFIDALTDLTRRADAKALVRLMQNAAGEKPKMWGPSIIGFGSYHYKYDSGREGDMPLSVFRRERRQPFCISRPGCATLGRCSQSSESTRPARAASTSISSLM